MGRAWVAIREDEDAAEMMGVNTFKFKPWAFVIGAGIGGLSAAALLAQAGCAVAVLEGQTYPGGSAGTFYHKGYRFEAGPRWVRVAGSLPPTATNKILKRELVREGVGAGAAADTWWERDERGTAYSELSGSRD